MRVHITFMFIGLIVFSACTQKKLKSTDPDIYYTCSMDPQVVEYKPGICPICKMDLTMVRKSKAGKEGEISLSDQQIRLGNITTDTIRKGSFGDRQVLTGTLNYDQMKTVSLSSKVAGRIERLYIKTTGQIVQKGAPLYELYSEELNNAKQEYLLAVSRRKTFSTESIIDIDQVISAARQKLLLWGMTEKQIDDMAGKGIAPTLTTIFSQSAGYVTSLNVLEGDNLMEGTYTMKLTDLSTLWAEAQVFSTQMNMVDPGGMATVELPDFNGLKISGRLDFVNPEISPDTRINLIRVSIPNTNYQLKPGMPVYVFLENRPKKVISLPIDAVLRDGRGNSVWISQGNNSFVHRMVHTGIESGDQIEIMSGLNDGDVVVISGAYLLHSEYIFKRGLNPMAAHSQH